MSKITWTGAGDGSTFSNGANWLGGMVPGAGDTASIGDGFDATVTTAGSVLGVDLGNGDVLQIKAAFTVGFGGVNNQGGLQVDGGNLILSGGTVSQGVGHYIYARNGGTVTLNGGDITGGTMGDLAALTAINTNGVILTSGFSSELNGVALAGLV